MIMRMLLRALPRRLIGPHLSVFRSPYIGSEKVEPRPWPQQGSTTNEKKSLDEYPHIFFFKDPDREGTVTKSKKKENKQNPRHFPDSHRNHNAPISSSF